ncbi:RICIN domain-containing protein [Streptomyces achromogenes]|uniref:RICIN domain-containing protein n=1 Tax=Streptomyces achromogenes TaxID=67255 RepID=UPI0036917EF5
MPFPLLAARHQAAAWLAALLLTGLATAPAPATAEPVPVPPYRGVTIRAAADPELVLDVAGSTTDDGARIHVQKYTGANDQLWLPVPAGENTFEIRNLHSRKCLDVRENSNTPDTDLIQYHCHDGPNQHWSLREAGDGLQLMAAGSRLCADVFQDGDNEPTTGARLVQYTCSNPARNDQRWTYQPT